MDAAETWTGEIIRNRADVRHVRQAHVRDTAAAFTKLLFSRREPCEPPPRQRFKSGAHHPSRIQVASAAWAASGSRSFDTFTSALDMMFHAASIEQGFRDSFLPTKTLF